MSFGLLNLLHGLIWPHLDINFLNYNKKVNQILS